MARAARAAGAHLQAAGVELATVTLMPRSILDERESLWAVDCREAHLRCVVVYLGYNRITNGLFVLHPERKRTLRALRLTAPDPAACRTTSKDGCRSARRRSTGFG